MSRLTDALSAYGADVPGALARLCGDEDFYAQCLASLRQDPGFSDLMSALAAGDHAAAFDTVHTLKGVAANLGLVPLAGALSEVTELLRAGQYDAVPAAIPALLQAERTFFDLADTLV